MTPEQTRREKHEHLLGELAKDGKTIYKRVVLARDLLKDREWVVAEYGDESRARKAIQAKLFSDTAATLGQLFQILDQFPEEANWEAQGWDLKKLFAATKPEKGPRLNHTNWKKRTLDAEEQTKELSYRLKQQQEQTRALEAENQKLRTELAELRGRVSQMENNVTDLPSRPRLWEEPGRKGK
jgi:hypothetical protein